QAYFLRAGRWLEPGSGLTDPELRVVADLFPAQRSNDRMTDLGRYPFTNDHCRDNDEQDQRDLRPVKLRYRGVELKPDAPRADKTKHCRFTNIDIPTKHRNAGKGG